MLGEAILKIKFLVAVCAAVLVVNSSAYCAIVGKIDVDISCSKSKEDAIWYVYNAIAPKDVLTLYTIGIREAEKSGLLIGGDIKGVIRAICDGGILSNEYSEVQEKGSILRCEPGESLSIKMLEPNAEDQYKYRYTGVLVVERDIKDDKVSSKEEKVLRRRSPSPQVYHEVIKPQAESEELSSPSLNKTTKGVSIENIMVRLQRSIDPFDDYLGESNLRATMSFPVMPVSPSMVIAHPGCAIQ